jgi:hypothetical protein
MTTDERIRLILDMGASGANVEQVKRKLEELEPALHKAENKMAGFGQTALQSGRFLQDFAQGGVGGVLNNIEGLAMALGGGPGLAGVMTAVGLAAYFAMPKLKEFWNAMSGGGEGPAPIVQALDAVEERIKKIRAEFEKILASKPFEEKETQGRVEEYFAGQGGRITAGIQAALSATGTGERMTPAEAAAAAPEAIDRAVQSAAMAASRAGQVFTPAMEAEARRHAIENQQRAGVEAQKRIGEANLQRAAAIVGGAPGDAATRAQLGALARQRPEFFPGGFGEELARLEPEAVAAQEEEVGAAEAEGQRLHGAATERKARAARVASKRQREVRRLEERTRSDLADEQAGEQEAKRAEAEEFHEAMGAGVSERDIRHERATGMAEQLVGQQGANIAGMAFGPQAAMRAGAMGGGEIQAVKQQTIRNLEAGQLPYDAVAQAFMEVVQAADRQAQAAQRFTGQMNGMVGRMQSSPWPSGSPR